jgi:hypothetical protein
MSWEAVASLASLVVALGVLVAFITQAVKAGEEKGRLMQLVDMLKEMLVTHETRIGCVEADHGDMRTQFGVLAERLKGMDDKLSAIANLLERRRTENRGGE